MSRTRRPIFLLGILFLALFLCEGSLRLFEKIGGTGDYRLASALSESLYFHSRAPGDPLRPNSERFDPLLGWRAGPNPAFPDEKFNAQGWRSPMSFVERKSRTRVLLAGDEAIQGIGLDEAHTVATQLQGFLGARYEVMNFGASDYGLDQTAVLATQIAPRYDPDYVILSFTAEDLVRSCARFSSTQAAKPYFTETRDEVVLRGVPLPSPAETLARHDSPAMRWQDAFFSWAAHSRLLSLLAKPVLMADQKRCLGALNEKILFHVRRELGPHTALIFSYLGGRLPPEFLREMKEHKIDYLSMPDLQEKTAREIGVSLGSSAGLQDRAAWAKVVAKVYADLVHSLEPGLPGQRTLSSTARSK